MSQNESKLVFLRKEKKYILTREKTAAFLAAAGDRLTPDRFSRAHIRNLYLDTPNHLLIRRSIEKPAFKEKLRLRSYCIPDPDSPVFLEIKRKFSGTVYKRRITLPYGSAMRLLSGEIGLSDAAPDADPQIAAELDWSLQFYTDLRPAMFLSYKRDSYKQAAADSRESPLRLTLDHEILWRSRDLTLTNPDGFPLLDPDSVLMEIKTPCDAYPLWLTEILSDLKLYPASLSKYGTAYQINAGLAPDAKKSAEKEKEACA